jgi:F-type H+-transporting ATPase subunit alpha
MALNLEADNVGVVIFGSDSAIREGSTAKRTGTIVVVPVGRGLLGRVVDALGNPIDGKGPIVTDQRSRVEVKAPGIIPRKSVHEPMQTGLKALDALVPVGRGPARADHRRTPDRQDRRRARYLHQPEGCSPGRPTRARSSTASTSPSARSARRRPDRPRARREWRDGIFHRRRRDRVGAGPLQFLAPYTGCAMGEYFRDNGMHAVIVYDDLSKQAVAYRQMSLCCAVRRAAKPIRATSSISTAACSSAPPR